MNNETLKFIVKIIADHANTKKENVICKHFGDTYKTFADATAYLNDRIRSFPDSYRFIIEPYNENHINL
jgi:hypothetical protein